VKHYSKVIIGAGPVGLALALSLARSQINVVIIDPFVSKVDARVLALSYYSLKCLSDICDIENALLTPIKEVQISHSGFGFTNIRNQDLGIEYLGATVAYTHIVEQLHKSALSNPYITLISGMVLDIKSLANYSVVEYSDINKETQNFTTELLLVAEGGNLPSLKLEQNTYDYKSNAIIAQLRFTDVMPDIAYERFSRIGPMVIMPYNGHHVLVWSVSQERSAQYLADNQLLLDDLTQDFTERFGQVELIGDVASYPLKLRQTKNKVTNNIVVLGNAAQVVHPISAQGLNLGLRDVRDLTQLIINHGDLDEFNKIRKIDSISVIGFTHVLVTYLESDIGLARVLRSVGLSILQNQQLLRNKVAKFLIYGLTDE